MTVRERSIASTTATTRKSHHAVSTEWLVVPVSRVTASAATATLTSASTVASASAARCSAFPCPYWWPSSAGRPETPIAKNVSSAATRSVPECSASEMSPRLPLTRPAPSLSAASTAAAPIETSAVRRWGLMRVRLCDRLERSCSSASGGGVAEPQASRRREPEVPAAAEAELPQPPARGCRGGPVRARSTRRGP